MKRWLIAFGLWQHLLYARYVARHKWFVFVECARLGVPLRGLFHDLSKFRPREWMPYARYFYGKRYPDDEQRIARLVGVYLPTEAEYEAAFNRAWCHHQHRNDHHWQFWFLLLDDGGEQILPMPDAARREMLADWRGAGKAITGADNTRDWYLAHRTIMRLHPETREWIETQLGIVPADRPDLVLSA